MGGTLVLSSPFLYFVIPELRHLGRAAWEFYFLPTQTIFYFVITDEEERKAFKALKKWVVVISAVRAFNQTPNNLGACWERESDCFFPLEHLRRDDGGRGAEEEEQVVSNFCGEHLGHLQLAD